MSVQTNNLKIVADNWHCGNETERANKLAPLALCYATTSQTCLCDSKLYLPCKGRIIICLETGNIVRVLTTKVLNAFKSIFDLEIIRLNFSQIIITYSNFSISKQTKNSQKKFKKVKIDKEIFIIWIFLYIKLKMGNLIWFRNTNSKFWIYRNEAREIIKHVVGANEQDALFFTGQGAICALRTLLTSFDFSTPTTVLVGPHDRDEYHRPWRECGAKVKIK